MVRRMLFPTESDPSSNIARAKWLLCKGASTLVWRSHTRARNFYTRYSRYCSAGDNVTLTDEGTTPNELNSA